MYGFEHRIGNIQGFTKSKQSKEKMIQEQAHLTLTSQLRVRTFIFLSTSYFQGEVDPGEVQGSHAPPSLSSSSSKKKWRLPGRKVWNFFGVVSQTRLKKCAFWTCKICFMDSLTQLRTPNGKKT